MKTGWVWVAACALTGCTSVRMVQRDNCWVKQTEKWPNRVNEEIGPCGRDQPQWSEDRLTRLVQECVAEADYQWHSRAVPAWGKGEPLPEREAEQRILERCYADTAEMLIAEKNAEKIIAEKEAENRALRGQLSDMRSDREHMRKHTGALAEALGEAAKKPAPAAVATATARGDGNANTDSKSNTVTESTHTSTLGKEKRVTTPRTIPAPVPTANKATPAKPQCEPPKNATKPEVVKLKASDTAAEASDKAPDCDPMPPAEPAAR
ncbi:MAG: hypothetical protein WBV82_08760 [Myxococcaceae bacterium]